MLTLLGLDLRGHAIESARECPELLVALPFGHASGKVAPTDALSSARERADGPCQTSRETQSRPDRGKQDQDSHDEEAERELDLIIGALTLQAIVLLDRPLGLLHAIENHGIGDAANIQISVPHCRAEAHQRAHAILVVAGEHRDIAVVRVLESRFRWGVEHERIREASAREHAAVGIEHQGLREISERCLQLQHLREILGIIDQELRVVIDVGRHLHDVSAYGVLMLMEVGLGYRQRFGECGPDPVAEPRLHAEAEKEIRGERQDDGGRHRDDAEQHDQPHMEPRTRVAATALSPDLHQARRDDSRQRQEQHQVEIDERQDQMWTVFERRPAGERAIGADAGDHSRNRERDRELAPEPDPTGPSENLP